MVNSGSSAGWRFHNGISHSFFLKPEKMFSAFSMVSRIQPETVIHLGNSGNIARILLVSHVFNMINQYIGAVIQRTYLVVRVGGNAFRFIALERSKAVSTSLIWVPKIVSVSAL